MKSKAVKLLILVAVLAVNMAWAGGSGLNVIVVVNQNSTNSVQLGNDYCELRGVPPQNLLRMTNWAGSSVNWSPAAFQTNLLNPLLALVTSRGLTQQVQYVVLSMDIPYRVQDGTGQNSTTSALFYGFKTNGAPVAGLTSCSLPDNTSNSYAYSELPFNLATPNTARTNSFLAMMLTDTNLATAESILLRAVAADYSNPTQTVYLEKTSDSARSVRFVEFDNAVFGSQVAGNFSVQRINTNSTTFTNIFGLMTGLDGFNLNPNTFMPGALADSLTSYGGYILEPSSQTQMLAFVDAGAAATYGTIVEPCAYTQKFPDPVDYFYQRRGFSIAEAYYQSVLNPFQGLMLGEPLAAPFARPAGASWNSLTNGTILSGVSALSPTFTSAVTNPPLSRADLFVDGSFFRTMTNLPPTAGNAVSVVLNGHTVNYTVPANATLATVASGVAAALNTQSGITHVTAIPTGDRIELQSLSLSVPGSNVTVSVSAAIGSAPRLTTSLSAARPVFLDTVATGYEVVTLFNTPSVGDWIQATIAKTNGATITLGVTNASGTTLGTMAQNLVNLINTNATLQSADGAVASDLTDYGNAVQFFLYARTPGWPASQILATFTTSANLSATPAGMNPLADNVTDLRPRNHLYVSSGTNSLAINFACDTTLMADGYHELAAVAYEGTSVATQTRVTRNVRVQNTSLSATLAALPAGSNATLGQSLQFTVSANVTNTSRIELFGTGGSLGVSTNQAVANFAVATGYLGLGLHPFYAVVTDLLGNRFQTATVSYRIVPVISLTLTGRPPVLAWSATTGRQYDLQFTTNLLTAFQTVTKLTATNSLVQVPITPTNATGFYRVRYVQ